MEKKGKQRNRNALRTLLGVVGWLVQVVVVRCMVALRPDEANMGRKRREGKEKEEHENPPRW